MSIKIKKFKKDQVVIGAKIALKHRLFVSGWLLSWEFKNAIIKPEIYEIAITYKNNIPIAVALMKIRSSYNSIGAFCRKSERKNGYARMAVKALKPPKNCSFGNGVDGSDIFWKKSL